MPQTFKPGELVEVMIGNRWATATFYDDMNIYGSVGKPIGRPHRVILDGLNHAFRDDEIRKIKSQ